MKTTKRKRWLLGICLAILIGGVSLGARSLLAGGYLAKVARPMTVTIDGIAYFVWNQSGSYYWGFPADHPGADLMAQTVLTAYLKGLNSRVSCVYCQNFTLDMRKVGYTGVWTIWIPDVVDTITY